MIITIVATEDANWTNTTHAFASRLAAEDSVIALARTETGYADITYDEALDILSGRGWELTVEDVEVQP